MLAIAEREATSIEARAEGQAAKIYADSYRQDPELFRLLRQLEAGEAALGPDDLVIVGPDSPVAAPLLEGP